jgi:hypothetical protein
MAVSVVKFEDGVVTLESDFDGSRGREFSLAIGELGHMNTRKAAEAEAVKHGLNSPGVGIPTAPYAVDRNGEMLEGPTGHPYRYRIDVPVQARTI